jgi:hypothetical protein
METLCVLTVVLVRAIYACYALVMVRSQTGTREG